MPDSVSFKDVEFALEFLTPEQALYRYPKISETPQSPWTTTYCIVKCETGRGPFVCILPIDGRKAILEPDLAQTLVTIAYDQLAEKWMTEGYDH